MPIITAGNSSVPDESDSAKLQEIKRDVKQGMDYFYDNIERFNNFRRFIFETNWTDSEKGILLGQGSPDLEFNISEAFMSRQLGEFAKQEPSIVVSAANNYQADPALIETIENHTRYFLCDAKDHNNVQYENIRNVFSGGYSVFKLYTDYENERSFDQEIYLENANPVLCGFDPVAKLSHKGDGRWCFELRPMSEAEFKEDYPEASMDNVGFARGFSGFNWSYSQGNVNLVMVCDFYEKKCKKVTIVKTSDPEHPVMTEKEYNKMVANWDDVIEPPVVIARRKTKKEEIWRYRVYEGGILEKTKTDYSGFPLIFVDGNSAILSDSFNYSAHQMTRPYLYHAKGAQKLKNRAGCALANEIENIVQHKFMVAKEALPKEDMFLKAYTDVQKANVLVYNAFFEQDPDKPINNPLREVVKTPAPPEIIQAFTASDSLMQLTLGSFDASMGINDNQLSGEAIFQGASQSNAAVMPYLVGYLAGLQRVADLYVKMLPKYYNTPRTIPVRDMKGNRSYVTLQKGFFSYDESDLHVKVEAGVNFRVQKDRALLQITRLMQVSTQFAQFINERGLDTLLDNMEFRGLDALKEQVDSWQQEQQVKQAQAAQMAQQQMMMNPQVMKNQIDMQKLQQESQKSQTQFQIDLAKLKNEQNRIIADVEQSQSENQVQLVKAQTERFAKAVDLELRKGRHHLDKKDQTHRHAMDILDLHHRTEGNGGEENEGTETDVE